MNTAGKISLFIKVDKVSKVDHPPVNILSNISKVYLRCLSRPYILKKTLMKTALGKVKKLSVRIQIALNECIHIPFDFESSQN